MTPTDPAPIVDMSVLDQAVVAPTVVTERRTGKHVRAEDMMTKPDPVNECNWLICDAYGASDPKEHHKNCPGHKAGRWRARVTEPFVHEEIDRLRGGKTEDWPTFRSLAVRRALEARYGEEAAAS